MCPGPIAALLIREILDRVQNLTGPTVPSGGRVIYKTMVLVHGQFHPKYSNAKPGSGTFEVVVIGR